MINLVQQMSNVPGGKILQNRTFRKELFNHVQDAAPRGTTYTLRNVRFEKCKIDLGPFMFGGNWHMENVAFSLVGSTNVYIWSNIPLLGVNISGGTKTARLIMHPEKGLQDSERYIFSHDSYELDISSFKGDVEILGVDTDNIKLNPERHVKLVWNEEIRRKRKLLYSWETTWWDFGFMKMRSMKSPEMIVGVPDKTQKSYEFQMRALEEFRRGGVIPF